MTVIKSGNKISFPSTVMKNDEVYLVVRSNDDLKLLGIQDYEEATPKMAVPLVIVVCVVLCCFIFSNYGYHCRNL